MQSPTVVIESRKQAAFRLAGCAALAGASVVMLTMKPLVPLSAARQQEVFLIGWLGGIFFALLTCRFGWAVIRPGTLTISSAGIERDLGWRKAQWAWRDISDVQLRTTSGNFVSYCMIYRVSGWPVSLFGWQKPASDIAHIIDGYRSPNGSG